MVCTSPSATVWVSNGMGYLQLTRSCIRYILIHVVRHFWYGRFSEIEELPHIGGVRGSHAGEVLP